LEKKETNNLRVLTHNTYDIPAIWDDQRPFVKETDIEKSLGWELKPEGLCKDDSCIPYTPLNDPDSGYVDFLDITNTLGFSNVLDVELGLAAVDTFSLLRSSALKDRKAPNIELPDVDGQLHSLSKWSDKKKLLVAFSSW
tara:strand:- start:1 stop:420 length:420 start_codon:yes stop_codon:yes gene_type:complete